MLRTYVGKKHRLYDKWLHKIEFAYNDHVHSTTDVSPFYVFYDQECRTLIALSTSNFRVEYMNKMIQELNDIRKSTKLAMKSAQNRTKYFVDNKRFLVNLE